MEDNLCSFCNFSRADIESFADLIKFIISSIASKANKRPFTIWSLSSAFFNKNAVLRLIVSTLKSRKTSNIFLSESVVGSPFTKARIFALKLFCRGVNLNKLFKTTCG